MGLRKILHFPNPKLRLKAKKIEGVDDDIRLLIQDMFETMYEGNGIGLAATQIDVQLRIFVADLSPDRSQAYTFINPIISERKGERTHEEGCLSLPGIYAQVTRADSLVVEALDAEGKPFKREVDSLLATCIQHEVDHLDGKVFIDYLSPLKRHWFTRKLKKLRKKTL